MTLPQLIADLQDAWRRAMADGSLGVAQSGRFFVSRERARVFVFLITSATISDDWMTLGGFEAVEVDLDADINDRDVAADLAWVLLQRARETRIEEVAP